MSYTARQLVSLDPTSSHVSIGGWKHRNIHSEQDRATSSGATETVQGWAQNEGPCAAGWGQLHFAGGRIGHGNGPDAGTTREPLAQAQRITGTRRRHREHPGFLESRRALAGSNVTGWGMKDILDRNVLCGIYVRVPWIVSGVVGDHDGDGDAHLPDVDNRRVVGRNTRGDAGECLCGKDKRSHEESDAARQAQPPACSPPLRSRHPLRSYHHRPPHSVPSSPSDVNVDRPVARARHLASPLPVPTSFGAVPL